MGRAWASGVTPDADQPVPAAPRSRLLVVARAALLLGLVVFGCFDLMLAAGAASFVSECDAFFCAQLHQAVFAAIGGVALFVTASRVFTGAPSAATIAFLGTLPILVVHIILVMEDPNESIFFPLSTTPPPTVAGAFLLAGALRREGRGSAP